jgi:hypothetical protein
MGYTDFTLSLLKKALKEKSEIYSVVDLGSQNLHLADYTGMPFANELYERLGIDYTCIDLAGDNNALQLDLSRPIDIQLQFHLLVDAGTSEHVVKAQSYPITAFHDGQVNSVYPAGEISEKDIQEGFYNCWLNKHCLLTIGGIMINENPLTQHWPGHSYSYLSASFYTELAKIAGYEIIEEGVHCAMGNCDTGKNVYSILRKISDQFPSFEEFYEKLPIFRS